MEKKGGEGTVCCQKNTEVLARSILVVKINSYLLSVSLKPLFSDLISGFVSNKISEFNPVINNGNVLCLPWKQNKTKQKTC